MHFDSPMGQSILHEIISTALVQESERQKLSLLRQFKSGIEDVTSRDITTGDVKQEPCYQLGRGTSRCQQPEQTTNAELNRLE